LLVATTRALLRARIQINLIVHTKENQISDFWQEVNSLDTYVKTQTAYTIERETLIDGERLVWLKNQQNLKLVAYHNSAVYEFNVYSVDSTDLEKFISSFKFLNEAKSVSQKFTDTNKGFYFTHSFDIVQKTENDDSLVVKLSNLSSKYPEDTISVNYIETETYKDEDAKFGPFQLRYNENNNCWESYSESSKGDLTGVVFSCKQPNLYTDSGLQIFQSTVRWKNICYPNR